MIDTVDNIWNIVTGGGSQQYFGGTWAQMTTETLAILPHAGIIDNQRIANAVFGVINFRWRVGVDHLDRVAVDHQCIFALQHSNSAFKGTVH